MNSVLIELLMVIFTLQGSYLTNTSLASQEMAQSTSSNLLTAEVNYNLTSLAYTFDDPRNEIENFDANNSMHSEHQLPFVFDVEAPIKTIMSFCPNTQSCQHENITQTSLTDDACCIPCHCSDRCFVAGNCCIDKEVGSHGLGSSFNVLEETCVNTFISSNISKSFSYLLFQGCPENVDYEMQKKCLHPDVFQLDEMMPAFSRMTNRHYRNMFCAKCNNDSGNAVLWQTLIRCYSDSSSSGLPILSDNFSVSALISTNPSCALFWDPPLNVKKVDRCLSEEIIVSDCNKPILETLCKQYYAPVKGGGIIYRNLFCMECAHPSDLTDIYDFCTNRGSYFPQEKQFTSILSLNIDQTVDSESDDSEVKKCPLPKRYSDNLVSGVLTIVDSNCVVDSLKSV